MPITVTRGEGGDLLVTYDGFRQGLDSRSAPTSVTPTRLPDLANVLVAGGYPSRLPGSTLFATDMVMPDGQQPLLHAVYRDVTAGTNTHIVAGTDSHMYRWTGTAFVSLRRGLAWARWTDEQISDVLVLGNGTDPNQKYDGTRLLPLGAKHILDAEDGEATWAGGSAETTATYIKQGVQSRKVTSTNLVPNSAALTPTTPWDLTTGILSAANGGVDYSTSDYIDFWVYIDTAANLRLASSFIILGNAGDTHAFSLLASAWGTLADGWNKVHALKSAFSITGAPDWNNIAKVGFVVSAEAGVTVNCWFDDCYMIYANVMPPVEIVIEWKGMLLGMNAAVKPSGLYFSIVGGPDIWDPNAVTEIEEGDGTEITGAFPGYGDQLIVCKSNSLHPVSVRLTGEPYPDYIFASPRRLTAEHGCDSHKSLVEGGGNWYMWWKGGLYRYKGIGTERVSFLFDPPTDRANGVTLQSANNAQSALVVGAALRSRNACYWFYPTGTDTSNSAGILFDYIEQAATPLTGQALATAYTLRDTAGEESLLTATYTGRILQQDTGSTFDGTSIPGSVTLPWTTAGGQMASWHEAHVSYDTQTSGTLLVEYRIARHPREFDAATWVQAASIDMSVSAEYGKVPIGEISPWIQLRMRSAADPFTLYWPVTLLGMVLGEVS